MKKFFDLLLPREAKGSNHKAITTLAIIVSLILFGGLWITTNISKTLADGTELNSTNIVTTYGCATDATMCSYHMEEGGISSIAPNTFVNHTLLQYLSLAINNLTSIQSGDFTGLDSLTTLSLYGNYIGSIESDDLIELPNLIQLYLLTNRIEYIETGFFDAHTGLEMLDLRNNLLTTLPEAIMQLTNLEIGLLKLNTNCRNTGLMSADLINFLDEKAGSSAWQSNPNSNCPVVIDRAATYTAIDTELEAQGIETTFDQVTNENATGFENLYIAKYRDNGGGAITFQEPLDLTSTGIQDFLQNLSGSFVVGEDGKNISFVPTGNGSGLNVAAQIVLSIEEPPFLGTGNTADYLITRDNDNNILTGDDLADIFSGDIECVDIMGSYSCIFYVNHFTSFELYYPPFDCNDVTDVSTGECEALVDLYDATNGDNREEEWFGSNEVCEWYGIDCDIFGSDTHITSLDLEDVGLEGDIPESFGDLIYLTEIDLSYNYISSIPSTIENLVNLTDLNLYSNELSSIPESIGNLTGLQNLAINMNNLTRIPESIGNLTQLINLDLARNHILSLPETIGNLQNLERLYVQINNLTTLPESFSSLSTGINLDIRGNCLNVDTFSSSLYAYLQEVHESLSPETRLDRWDESFGGDWQGGEGSCPSDNITDPDDVADGVYTSDIYIFGGAGSTGASFVGDHRVMIQPDEGDLCPNEGCPNWLRFTTDGFSIVVTSGTWDGLLYAPIDADGEAEFDDTGIPGETETSGNTTTTRAILVTKKAGSFDAGLQAVGGNFTISFVVPSGTSGEVLAVYRSQDADTREINEPDANCTLDENLVCSFLTDHLSYFTTLRETTTTDEDDTPDDDDTPPSGGNGGGGGAISRDTCPSGDFSSSFYDNSCGTTPSGVTGKNNELLSAYNYAHKLGITSAKTFGEANMEGVLLRSHLAKMIVNYAINVLGLKPDIAKICTYSDVVNETIELQEYMTFSCQLGIMGINPDGTAKKSFEPNGIVSRAEFGTVLSRLLWGDKYNDGVLYYTDHLQALKDAKIMNNISNPERTKELRGWVILMMMRANK